MNSPLNERLGEAFVNKKYKAVGLPLRPFSLWHLFLLTSGDSPFLRGKAIIGWPELRWAVSICRSQYPNINWPSGMELAKSLLVCPFPSLGNELLNFNTYILDHYSAPLVWHKEGENMGQNDILAGILTVVLSLVRAGFGHNETWNMSVGVAYWYFCMIAKEKGAQFELVTPSEMIAMEKVAKMRAQNGQLSGLN